MQDGDALAGVFGGVEFAQDRAGDARKDARRHFENGHLKTHVTGDSSRFKADIAGANDDDAASSDHLGLRRSTSASERRSCTPPRSAPAQRQRPRARSGRQDQGVIGQVTAVAELDLLVCAVDLVT